MKEAVFRPKLDDVERISYGKAARVRGTGSSLICHRLNQNERKLFELAKQAGYLTVRGTGYRKNRKGSPLENIFRQRCDALSELCCIIEKKADYDKVLIDFSTLRVKDDSECMSSIIENVFKAKYTYLKIDVIFGSKISIGIDETDVRSKLQSLHPIDWEAVKTKAIWGVDYRLITVDCERDVAKAIVNDVIKESMKFDILLHQQRNRADDKLDIMDDIDKEITPEEEEEENIIDWDDI